MKAGCLSDLAALTGGDEGVRAELERIVQDAKDSIQHGKQQSQQAEVALATTAAALLHQGNYHSHEYHYSMAS